MSIVYGGAADNAPPTFDILSERPTVPLPIVAGSSSTELLSRPCILVGWALRETTGAAVAGVRFWNGGGTGGVLAGSVNIASGGSDHEALGPDGVLCNAGLFFEVRAGSVDGAVWVKL